MGKKIEMIGRKFGKLTVLSQNEYRGKSGNETHYECLCDCGNTSRVLGTALRRKDRPTTKCRECSNKEKQKYGDKVKGTKLYKTWDGMKYRCHTETSPAFKHYGARGISVCDEWRDKEVGFLNFKNWSLENGYEDSLSIDRINNDGNYEPSNCRWVGINVQANNKSINKLIEYNSITKTMSQWAKEYNIPYVTFQKRLEANWEIERALTEEVTQKRKKKIEIEGKLYTYDELGEIAGASAHAIASRYSRGKRGKELMERGTA